MKLLSRTAISIVLQIIFLSLACAPAIASIDPATLKALPDEVRAGRHATFTLVTEKREGIRAVEVSYRGPEIWFARSLSLSRKEQKKQKDHWEVATPERFDHEGEIIYSLRLIRDDGTEIVTDEQSSTIVPADIPPVITDPHPSPIFPVAGASFRVVTQVTDDRGVKRVTLFYRMGEEKKFREVAMRRQSGRKNEGKWSYHFGRVKNAGSITCYVMAWDSARQSARSEEMTFAIRPVVSPPPAEEPIVDEGESRVVPSFSPQGPKPLEGKVVTVDAGHGLYWTGKEWSYQRPCCTMAKGKVVCRKELCSSGLVEDEITVVLAEKTARYLRNLGATVHATRDIERQGGTGASGYPMWMEGALCYLAGAPETAPEWRKDDVHVRWQYAEFMGSDIMVSIHVNLGRMSGTETIYSYDNTKDGRDRQLAHDIQNAVMREVRRRDPLWVDRRARTDLEASAHFNAVVKHPLLPSVIVEAGFNDNPRDHRNLKDPVFQDSFARGVATGILRYFGREEILYSMNP